MSVADPALVVVAALLLVVAILGAGDGGGSEAQPPPIEGIPPPPPVAAPVPTERPPAPSAQTDAEPEARAPDPLARAERLAGGASTAQLVGQHLVYAFDGPTVPGFIRTAIRDGRAAGVIVFERNFSSESQLRRMTSQLARSASRGPIPLAPLVLVDQEGGLVRRLPGPPRRSAASMARLPAARIAAIGAASGSYLLGLGVNVDLAPVADVGYGSGVLAGEGRTFGSTPADAARGATAFLSGLQRSGVAATAKHFPGFGAATTNTDDAPTSIELSTAERRAGLAPFREAVAAGSRLVMLSTAVYPGLARRPAALAAPIATGLLRDELGFAGVSISDALDTPALAPYGSSGEVAVEAARAGTDLLIYARSTAATLEAEAALRAATAAGRLQEEALREAAVRVLTLRADLTG